MRLAQVVCSIWAIYVRLLWHGCKHGWRTASSHCAWMILIHPRVKPGSAAQIIDDLRWLGMDWDQFENILYPPDEHNIYTESHFITYYQAAFSKLAQLGLLYPCTCSRQDIRHKVVKPNEAGHYVYPGTCRGKRLEDIFPGQQFVWRCIVPDETVLFSDQLAGDQAQNVAAVWGGHHRETLLTVFSRTSS